MVGTSEQEDDVTPQEHTRFYSDAVRALHQDNWIPLHLDLLERCDSTAVLSNLCDAIKARDLQPVAPLYRDGRPLGRSSAAEVETLLVDRLQVLIGQNW